MDERPARLSRAEALTLIAVTCVALVASGWQPYERGTWWLEVFPILIAAPVLWITSARFPLTPLVYRLIFLHALVLILGGHYTYARVPLGFWVQDLLGLERNHYDRLGHFMQGLVPAMIVREVFVRLSIVGRRSWLPFLVSCVCLSISACYEFLEWGAAVVLGQGADAFLGTQGDPWDTQWDMFLALIGSIVAQLTLSRLHDRQMNRRRQEGERQAAGET